MRRCSSVDQSQCVACLLQLKTHQRYSRTQTLLQPAHSIQSLFEARVCGRIMTRNEDERVESPATDESRNGSMAANLEELYTYMACR